MINDLKDDPAFQYNAKLDGLIRGVMILNIAIGKIDMKEKKNA